MNATDFHGDYYGLVDNRLETRDVTLCAKDLTSVYTQKWLVRKVREAVHE